MAEENDSKGALCGIGREVDLSGVEVAELAPAQAVADYREAMALADAEAARRLGGSMLLSWYDRDRDFESPQGASECHADSAVPGYLDYGLNRGATLLVDVEGGRFVFLYLPLEA